MKQEEIDEIRKRADAATPGPWIIERYFPHQRECESVPRFIRIRNDKDEVFSALDFEIKYADAGFIAHARTDIPALLAEIDRLKEMVVKEELAYGQLTHYNAVANARAERAEAELKKMGAEK